MPNGKRVISEPLLHMFHNEANPTSVNGSKACLDPGSPALSPLSTALDPFWPDLVASVGR
ncbi:unnamed protein product [Protopolystoma xenopodis]|uniref:Uncharacterized protein n=1 Tax=Protopolystoma xenopodis TaxID=117903 RepID=A0A3S5A096_9PLAT|nr:unnamed protein product [Protopolystoma xenopodis]